MMIDESVAIVDVRIYWWLCWSKMQKQIAFFEWFNTFFEGASDSMRKADVSISPDGRTLDIQISVLKSFP